jgi:hypothetical protein
MEGKRNVSDAAKSEGRAKLAAGDSPNQALVEALEDYADACFDEGKASGE